MEPTLSSAVVNRQLAGHSDCVAELRLSCRREFEKNLDIETDCLKPIYKKPETCAKLPKELCDGPGFKTTIQQLVQFF